MKRTGMKRERRRTRRRRRRHDMDKDKSNDISLLRCFTLRGTNV